MKAAIALALVMLASGCCGSQSSHPEVSCSGTAPNVSVSAPAALGLGPTLLFASAQSCLDIAGQCSSTPSFKLDTIGNRPMTGVAPGLNTLLALSVSFPETAGGMTLTLPSADVQAMATLYPFPELAVSGTISVESVSQTGFQLSLKLDLLTNDGQTITVTGAVTVSNCAVRQVADPSTCGGGFS
jgi:hypothetical protein